MNTIARTTIQTMTPYAPPPSGRREYSGLILDFNERTTPPSAKVRDALCRAAAGKLQMYPEYGELARMVAQYAGTDEKSVLVTNGSDEAISLIFRTFVDSGDTVVIPEPSFSMFSQAAQIAGATVVSPSFDAETGVFPMAEVRDAAEQKPKLMILCNPNNPTGTLLSVSDIEAVASNAPDSLILVDEAYAEFSGVTAAALIPRYPNLVITRTFSKAFGLAGLRIGYILADSARIGELSKAKGPYDVNLFADVAARAALSDLSDMRAYTEEVMTRSKPILEAYFRRVGVPFYPSDANFLLIRVTDAKQTAETLRRNGVLVRRQSKPGLENCLRVSIGTVSETRRFTAIFSRTVIRKPTAPKKIAFFDRDGTLIYEPQDTYQINSVSELRVLPGAVETLRRLTKEGYLLVMITNQDGLGTAAYPKMNFTSVQRELTRRFKKDGVVFRKIFVCPHLPSDSCVCRKPNTGLLDAYLGKTTLDRDASFVCGDRPSDAGLAANLGIRFVQAMTNGNLVRAFPVRKKEEL